MRHDLFFDICDICTYFELETCTKSYVFVKNRRQRSESLAKRLQMWYNTCCTVTTDSSGTCSSMSKRVHPSAVRLSKAFRQTAQCRRRTSSKGIDDPRQIVRVTTDPLIRQDNAGRA